MIFSKKHHFLKKLFYFLRGSQYKVPFGCISTENGRNLKVGINVSFGGNVLLFGRSSIEIGDNTMVAYGVIIHTSTHDYNDHPMSKKVIDRPVKIGCHVWIGTGAIILPGVIVGDYSVVGAGSVVASHVPNGAIVAGNPAKIVKYRKDIHELKEIDMKTVDYQILEKGYLELNKICKERMPPDYDNFKA